MKKNGRTITHNKVYWIAVQLLLLSTHSHDLHILIYSAMDDIFFHYILDVLILHTNKINSYISDDKIE